MRPLDRAFADFLAFRRRHRNGPDGDKFMGAIRATVPVARNFGWGRGKAIDRVYVERFLNSRAGLIAGRVLEIGDNSYTLAYGGNRVERSDILHVDASNPKATIVGDLSCCDHVPAALFDCVILTQTLQFIRDVRGALRQVHRLLKPGGSLVATFPGISQISDPNWGSSWYWGWSPVQATNLLEGAFPVGHIEVEALGNRFAATAMLYGLVVEEIEMDRLLADDGACALLVGSVATRTADQATT